VLKKGLDAMYIIFYIMFDFLVTPFSGAGDRNHAIPAAGEALSEGARRADFHRCRRDADGRGVFAGGDA
jgi:hypothetical protein